MMYSRTAGAAQLLAGPGSCCYALLKFESIFYDEYCWCSRIPRVPTHRCRSSLNVRRSTVNCSCTCSIPNKQTKISDWNVFFKNP
jgi:hypothetical protein